MPSADPGNVTPRTSRMSSTAYGKSAVNHTTCGAQTFLSYCYLAVLQWRSLSLRRHGHWPFLMWRFLSRGWSSRWDKQLEDTAPCPTWWYPDRADPCFGAALGPRDCVWNSTAVCQCVVREVGTNVSEKDGGSVFPPETLVTNCYNLDNRVATNYV
jgi:hypothetical protein